MTTTFNPCLKCAHNTLRVCKHLCPLIPEQLDMFGDQVFGTSWKSQKLRWDEKRDLTSSVWDSRRDKRRRGIYAPQPTNPILRRLDFDVKSLWIPMEDQAEARHTKAILDEFDARV